MADPISGAPPNPAPASPVAGSVPPPPPGSAAATPTAYTSAPLFGGLRGGRPRLDGLKPGSPEALAADREKDRLRKDRQRSRAAEPAPLPTAGVGGQATAPGLGLAVQPGLDGIAPAVPWDQQTLKPLFDQLIPTVEQLTVNQITTRANKARLPKEVLSEIEKDARWTAPARKALEVSAPQVAAKWLNKSGISAENQAELVLGTAIASIMASQVLLLKRLDKLIQETNAAVKPPEPKPEAKP